MTFFFVRFKIFRMNRRLGDLTLIGHIASHLASIRLDKKWTIHLVDILVYNQVYGPTSYQICPDFFGTVIHIRMIVYEWVTEVNELQNRMGRDTHPFLLTYSTEVSKKDEDLLNT